MRLSVAFTCFVSLWFESGGLFCVSWNVTSTEQVLARKGDSSSKNTETLMLGFVSPSHCFELFQHRTECHFVTNVQAKGNVASSELASGRKVLCFLRVSLVKPSVVHPERTSSTERHSSHSKDCCDRCSVS